MSSDETTDLGSLAAEETVLTGHVTGALPAGFDAPLDTDDAQLVGADLHDARILDGRWSSTTVTGSDLGRTQWEATRLADVDFEDCDLTGLQVLDKTVFERVTFTNCKLAYSNWFDCVLDDVRFVNCHFRESRFASMTMRAVIAATSDFTGATFDRMELRGVGDFDLRGSTIEETSGLPHIRGLRVDTTQAAAIGAALLAAHGIVVADDE